MKIYRVLSGATVEQRELDLFPANGQPLFSMKRKKPLRRLEAIKRTARVWTKSPLKKVSRSRRKQVTKYLLIHKEYLQRFPVCGICLVLGAEYPNAATEIHHRRGRIGRLLTYEPEFVPCCRPHREFPHENPDIARELGILAGPAEWNVFPE